MKSVDSPQKADFVRQFNQVFALSEKAKEIVRNWPFASSWDDQNHKSGNPLKKVEYEFSCPAEFFNRMAKNTKVFFCK